MYACFLLFQLCSLIFLCIFDTHREYWSLGQHLVLTHARRWSQQKTGTLMALVKFGLEVVRVFASLLSLWRFASPCSFFLLGPALAYACCTLKPAVSCGPRVERACGLDVESECGHQSQVKSEEG